jgi:hypothetical protein
MIYYQRLFRGFANEYIYNNYIYIIIYICIYISLLKFLHIRLNVYSLYMTNLGDTQNS